LALPRHRDCLSRRFYLPFATASSRFHILTNLYLKNSHTSENQPHRTPASDRLFSDAIMALDTFYNNKIEQMKLDIIQGQAVLRRLEAQRNEYNSRVRLLREELGLLQQPGSYVGEVVKVMGTKKVLVKVHPEGKYGKRCYCPNKYLFKC
jgi:hypothetical protein